MNLHRLRGRAKKSGLPPGTVVYVGKQKVEQSVIKIMQYQNGNFFEKDTQSFEDVVASRDFSGVTWVNVDGLNVDVIESVGELFNLHPLTVEDIAQTEQRAKLEDFDNYVYIVLRMLEYDKQENEIISEQLSVILGSNWLISFQESVGDIFDPIRERLRNDKGRIRKMSAAYLVYTLIDAVVDNYFSVLEKMGEKIEDLEDELISNPEPSTVQAIHKLKRQSISLRKSVWPLRELINNFGHCESDLIDKQTHLYLRDVYDHTIQVIDSIETFRDMLAGMLDIYLSSMSNRMNEVMKVLTIIATIFIPLTLISGIYGMNFRQMPELDSPLGYPLVLASMLFVAVGMLVYFWRKKWILQG
jgi:magnesium transporter